jgi:hypothetical protein
MMTLFGVGTVWQEKGEIFLSIQAVVFCCVWVERCFGQVKVFVGYILVI